MSADTILFWAGIVGSLTLINAKIYLCSIETIRGWRYYHAIAAAFFFFVMAVLFANRPH